MRLFLLAIASALIVCAQDSDVVMKAMQDEMDRSMKQLTVENLEKPYFISYRVVDSEEVSVGASFGALNHSNSGRSRRLTVEVRVGDYKLDNSHLFTFDFDNGTRLRIFNGTTTLPLEDDYKELRRQIWLATDTVYKKAVEDLSKKRGLRETRSADDEADDFSKESAVTTSYERPDVKVNAVDWEKEARLLSALSRQMPAIYTSSVLFNVFNRYTRFLTSEGTSYTRREPIMTITGNAATQAQDGMPLTDFFWVQGRSLAEIPSQEELASRLSRIGRELTELRQADTLSNYNGPVLVENDAAAQLVRWNLVPSLVALKRTISGMPGAQSNPNQGAENPYLDKIGARILPEFLSLSDNPAIDHYQKWHLAGFSKMDEDGVLSREVKLIENGTLKALLASRDPVRGVDHSTGSRHAGQAAPSNLLMTVSNGLSATDLHAKFMEILKQRNRPFGIVVRRMSPNNTGSSVLLACKVFPDGHEELVRGMQFVGFNATSFKDVVAASSDLNFLTLRYVPPPGQFGMRNEGEDNLTPVSMLIPSLLFEDVTMRRNRAATPNPPVSGPPFFDK